MGGRDDVAQGRLDIANKVIENGGDKVNNPVAGFNAQAFLARLAARDIPDLVYMSRSDIGTYAAKNVLLPLANCLTSQKIDKKMYRAAALQEVTYKGQLYALPEFTNQITLIVNNDAARKAGVSVADIQTTNWKKLKQANKKLLKIDNGRLTRIGFDPKLPEFFPLWVEWFGKDLISKNGLKAQLNSREAVAALAYTVGLINDHGGWTKFKAFRDTWDFFGRNNQVAADQVGAWPMESFYYNTLAEGNPVNITAKYFTGPRRRAENGRRRRRTRAREFAAVRCVSRAPGTTSAPRRQARRGRRPTMRARRPRRTATTTSGRLWQLRQRSAKRRERRLQVD